jgi:hypothetical protein
MLFVQKVIAGSARKNGNLTVKRTPSSRIKTDLLGTPGKDEARGQPICHFLKLPCGQKVELLSGGATSNALTVNPIKL